MGQKGFLESSFDFANERGFNKEEIFSTFSTLLKKIGGSTSFYEMENVFYQGREWYNKRSLLDKYILELKGSGMNLEEGNVLLEKLSNKYNNFLPSDLLQLTTNSLDSMKNSAFISQEKIGVLLEASNILDENNFKDFTMHALPILVENKLTSEEITFLLNDLKRDIDKQDLWKALYNVEDIVKNSDWEENPSSYVNLEISNPRNDLFEVIGEEKEKIKQETGENPNPSGIDEKQYNQVKSAFDLYEKTTNSKIGKFLSKATGTNEEIKSLGDQARGFLALSHYLYGSGEPLEIEYSEEEWDEMVCISSGLWRPSEISGFSSEGGWESTRPLDSSGSFWNVAGTTQMVRKKIGESSSGKSKYFYSISENFDFVNSRYTKGFEEYNYEDDSSVSVYERSISQSLLKILQKALPTYFEGEEPILVYESFGSRYSADEVVLKVRADYVESHGTPMPILTYTVLEED